mmetsp:Transcript_117901/g.375888  ORF Transcript_117901/g.375888 Transcript_117901/m.375888 type:complete len:200 (+) Transcript_117901:893-1492(+)
MTSASSGMRGAGMPWNSRSKRDSRASRLPASVSHSCWPGRAAAMPVGLRTVRWPPMTQASTMPSTGSGGFSSSWVSGTSSKSGTSSWVCGSSSESGTRVGGRNTAAGADNSAPEVASASSAAVVSAATAAGAETAAGAGSAALRSASMTSGDSASGPPGATAAPGEFWTSATPSLCTGAPVPGAVTDGPGDGSGGGVTA